MTPGGIRTRDLSFHRRCNSDLHHGAWKGSAGNKRCCCCPCGRTAFRRAGLEPARRRSAFPRSNSHLHHRLPGASAPVVDRYAGELAISVSVTTTQPLALRTRDCAGPHADLCLAASRCVCHRRDSNPLFPVERSIRHLHHQRRLSRSDAANRFEKFRRGAVDAPPIANSSESALPSVSGSSPRSLRQAPRTWARASPREPRDPGLPFRLAPGNSNEPCCGQQKNPPEHLAREGPFRRTVDLALCEVAPMSRARATDRPQAVRQLAGSFKSVVHHLAHV
jgi:hypothetical protein